MPGVQAEIDSESKQALPGNLLTLFRVQFDKASPRSGNIGVHKDGSHWAFWFTEPAINALVWINVNHVVTFVDTINRADGHAGFILNTDAWFSYDVWHGVILT